VLLDKVGAFRHFIQHGYDCELDENELQLIQSKLMKEFSHFEKDLKHFREHIKKLAGAENH